MKHTEIRVITSAKGGVGKSTVAVGLGAALARRENRVLLVDCDAANRSLDLMLGLESSVVYGLSDVLAGRCDAARAILAVPGMEDTLFLLPYGTGSLSLKEQKDAFFELIRSLARDDGNDTDDGCTFDHILIDTPGGVREILLAAAAPAEEALIVSSAQPTAVRSAEMTASLLGEAGTAQQKLIINAYMGGEQFFAHTRVRTNRRTQARAGEALFHIIDSVALPLLGVVPFDGDIWESGTADDGTNGCSVLTKRHRHDHFTQAFDNIAARCAHKHVPLFSGS